MWLADFLDNQKGWTTVSSPAYCRRSGRGLLKQVRHPPQILVTETKPLEEIKIIHFGKHSADSPKAQLAYEPAGPISVHANCSESTCPHEQSSEKNHPFTIAPRWKQPKCVNQLIKRWRSRAGVTVVTLLP